MNEQLAQILGLYQAFGPHAQLEQQYLQNQLAMQEAELNEQNSGFDQIAELFQMMQMFQPDPYREAQMNNFEANTRQTELENMMQEAMMREQMPELFMGQQTGVPAFPEGVSPELLQLLLENQVPLQ